MIRKRITLYAAIALAFVMAITCPNHSDHREQICLDVLQYTRKEIKQAGLNDSISKRIYANTETAINECVYRTSYYPLLIVSVCTFEGNLYSIGILGKVITYKSEEDKRRFKYRLQQYHALPDA